MIVWEKICIIFLWIVTFLVFPLICMQLSNRFSVSLMVLAIAFSLIICTEYLINFKKNKIFIGKGGRYPVHYEAMPFVSSNERFVEIAKTYIQMQLISFFCVFIWPVIPALVFSGWDNYSPLVQVFVVIVFSLEPLFVWFVLSKIDKKYTNPKEYVGYLKVTQNSGTLLDVLKVIYICIFGLICLLWLLFLIGLIWPN